MSRASIMPLGRTPAYARNCIRGGVTGSQRTRRDFPRQRAPLTSIIPKEELPENILYLLGILNSSLISFYAVNHSPIFSGGFHKFSAPYLRNLPIRTINFSNTRDKSRHDELVSKVGAMLEGKTQLAKAKTDKDKTYYESRCAALDRQINRIVYELYGLMAEEIQIVEQWKEQRGTADRPSRKASGSAPSSGVKPHAHKKQLQTQPKSLLF